MKSELAQIFVDTQTQYNTNPVLIQSCHETRKNTKLYAEADEVECEKYRFAEKCTIVVSKKRSFEAASNYKGQKTTVLNFASSFCPGGGVKHGARAQEECLCRCSTLYDSLSSDYMRKNFYEKHCEVDDNLANDDIIYSPAVSVFKSDVYLPELLPQDEWFNVDVITCAAPNIYVGWNEKLDISDEELSNIHEKRLRKILDVAVAHDTDVIILGAFGCGAFGNPPQVVAAVAKKVLEDYRFAFKTVEFAVFCPPDKPENFEVFDKVFNNTN